MRRVPRIAVQVYGNHNLVAHNTLSDSPRYGIEVDELPDPGHSPASDNVVVRNLVRDAGVGIAIGPEAGGVVLRTEILRNDVRARRRRHRPHRTLDRSGDLAARWQRCGVQRRVRHRGGTRDAQWRRQPGLRQREPAAVPKHRLRRDVPLGKEPPMTYSNSRRLVVSHDRRAHRGHRLALGGRCCLVSRRRVPRTSETRCCARSPSSSWPKRSAPPCKASASPHYGFAPTPSSRSSRCTHSGTSCYRSATCPSRWSSPPVDTAMAIYGVILIRHLTRQEPRTDAPPRPVADEHDASRARR